MSGRYRKFLKTRGLLNTFRTFERIQGKRKKTFTTLVSQFTQGVSERKIYAVRENKKTVFRDFQTLEKIGESRKPLRKAIDSVFMRPSIQPAKITVTEGDRTQFEVRSSLKEYELKKPKREVHLRYTQKQSRVIPYLNIIRTHFYTNRSFKKHKLGFVGIDVEYRKARHQSVRLQVRSAGNFFLEDKDEVKKAIVSAIHNGLHRNGEVRFSPDEIIIHDYWFEYYEERQYRELRPRQRLPRGSRREVISA